MVVATGKHPVAPVDGRVWRGWPLVGRDRELAVLTDVLDQTDRAGVVLAGPAGVGKTRLARECVGVAERRGYRVARILATRSTSGVVLGALAPLLPPLPDRLELRADLLSWAADAIVSDGSTRTALLVDDVQLLDETSAVVVHQLVQAGRVFLVATMRSDAPAPDPIRKLVRDGRVARLDVGALDRGGVDALLDSVLGESLDGACRRDLWELSAGNPLFLHELVVGAVESGALRLVNGIWSRAGRLTATARVADLIDERLVQLSESDRRSMLLLAIGEPLGVEVFERLAGRSCVDRLGRSGLAEITRDGARPQARLAHPLFGEALRARASSVEEMAASRRLAAAVGSVEHLKAADALRVAVWRLDGGGPVDPRITLAAARHAFFAHDDELAARLARRAADDGAGIPAGLLLAQVLGLLGRHHERCALDDRLAAQPTTESECVMVAVDHAIGLFWGLGHRDRAVDILLEAERALPPGPWRDEASAQRSTFEMLGGRFADALAVAQPILEHSDSARARVTAAVAVAPALAVMGRGEEAVAVADAAFAAHVALGDQEALADPGIHVAAHVLALGELGRLRAAADTAAFAYDASIAARSRTGQGWFALMLGRIALTAGRLATAGRHFAEAAVAYRDLGQDGPLRWCLAGQVMACAMRGHDHATATAIDLLDRVKPQPMLMMEPEVIRARAWHAVASGDVDGGRRLLLEAAGVAEGAGAAALAVQAWHDLARVGFALEALVALERLVPAVAGPLAPARLQHVRAAVTRDSAQLEAVAHEFDAIGALLLAAEAAAGASAAAHAGQETRRAQRLSHWSHSLMGSCEGPRTPGLRLAGAGKVLTPREREVAVLAAQGVPSKTIATQLGLVARTVDNHLQRAYDKLGVSSRADLRDVLGDAGR